jgi:hypothetical protein
MKILYCSACLGYCASGEIDVKLAVYCCVWELSSGGPGSIPGTTRKKVVGLERRPLSLVSTTEELLDRKAAAPV